MLRSNETIIAQSKGAFSRPYFLIHVDAGEVPAGSGTRYQNECYGVLALNRDGSRWGQYFKTIEDARDYFETYSTPITETV